MEHYDLAGPFESISTPSPDVNPPEYPGPPEGAVPTASSAFQIPTFEEVMALYEYEDSLRLPTYQARQLGRYHPYQRFRRSPLVGRDIDRYINTIYDEEYVPLELPPCIARVRQPLPVQPVATAIEIAPAPEPLSITLSAEIEHDFEEERQRGLYRLHTDFLLTIRNSAQMQGGSRSSVPVLPENLLLIANSVDAVSTSFSGGDPRPPISEENVTETHVD